MKSVQEIDEIRNIVRDYLKYYGITLRSDFNVQFDHNGPNKYGFIISDGSLNIMNNAYYKIINGLGKYYYLSDGSALLIQIVKNGNINFYESSSGAKDAQITFTKISEFSKSLLNVNGRVTEQGTFADIHVEDNSTAQSIPTGTTYTKLTGFADNGENSNCTSDAANDKITITNTGRYLCNFSCSASAGTANVLFYAAAFLNGVEQHQVHSYVKLTTANDSKSMIGTGIIDVTTVPWDLDLRVRHDNAGSINFTPRYMNLNVSYLGET